MKIGWTRCAAPAVSALLLVALCEMGCVTAPTEAIVNIQIDSVPDPEGARAVTIASVTDSRSFTAYAEDLAQHQVVTGKERDPVYTARLFGVLRTRGGMILSQNYLLPENRTVAGLASTALANGFRRAGFSVVDADAPGFPDAIPVRADIKRFWLWLAPGGLGIQPLQFEILVSIETEVPPFQQPGEVRGFVFQHSMGPPGFQQATISGGLRDFSGNLAVRLREAATSTSAQDPIPGAPQASPPPAQ